MEKNAKKNRHRKTQSADKKGGEKLAKTNEEKIYENMKSLEEWAFAGISQKEMAEMLGMSYSTFRKLKSEISALSALLKKSADFLRGEKQKEVEKVEHSLLERCLGYNASVQKHYKLKKPMKDEDGQLMTDGNGKILTEEVLEEVTESQHVPADVTAIKFYLLNKARKDWKNDPERLAIEKKRLANDTKRTNVVVDANSGEGNGKTVEDLLNEAAQEQNTEE